MATQAQREFRAHVSRQDMPVILLWVGIIYGAMAVVTAVTVPHPGPIALALDLPVVAVMITVSFIMRRLWVTDIAATYLFAAVITLLCLTLLLQPVIFDEYSGLLYVPLVVLALGPALGSWRAYVPAASLVGVCYLPVTVIAVPDHWVSWALAAYSAIAGGAALLHARIATLDSLMQAQEQVKDLAIRDRLTGLLNRHGFDEVAPTLVGRAAREGDGLFACFLDLDSFKVANDTFGHEFGDRVLVAVAVAAQQVFRESDLLARWGGDEFVAVGPGPGPDPEALSERVNALVRDSGIDPRRWPGRVTIGKATGACESADRGTLDRLILDADADMYRRKVDRRGGTRSSISVG